jgi:hypothetical protein
MFVVVPIHYVLAEADWDQKASVTFHQKKKKIQNAHFLTICMGDCKCSCDLCHIAIMANPLLVWVKQMRMNNQSGKQLDVAKQSSDHYKSNLFEQDIFKSSFESLCQKFGFKSLITSSWLLKVHNFVGFIIENVTIMLQMIDSKQI